MYEFLSKLFDTGDFPARWHCGQWSASHGWLHILSDLAIFSAYMAIPLLLVWLVSQRKDTPFPRVFWLFAAFILFCGVTHLNEAVIFWKPAYRWAGVMKLGTALVSWATVIALVPVVRQALTLRTEEQVAEAVAARTEELELEAEQYAALVRSSDDAILTKDNDGIVRSWNPAAERIYGYTAEEMVGQSIERLVPEGALEELRALQRKLRSGGGSVNLRTRRRRKDGAELEVSVTASPLLGRNGEVVGASVIARDITAEAESEDLFRKTVESSPIGMLLVEPDGAIALANREAEVLFGYRRAELEAMAVEALVPADRRERHVELRSEYVRQPRRQPMGKGRELFGQRKDGSQVPVDVVLTPIERAGQPLTLAAVLDITERKEAERIQAEAHATLERRVAERTEELAQSNRDLEQFAYVASHDLKEPLRMVSSYCGLLREEYGDLLQGDAQVYLGYAVDGAERMSELLSDLLTFSRVGSRGGRFEPSDVGEVVQAVRDDLQLTLEEAGAELVVGELPSELVCDPHQLRQLLQNLVSNAVKFRREGVPPRIEIGARSGPDGWTFTVADNGIGFEEKHAERVFTIFKRLHPRARYEGSGIGLAIAKRIVERHRGEIWVESEPGVGTTFSFRLGDLTQG